MTPARKPSIALSIFYWLSYAPYLCVACMLLVDFAFGRMYGHYPADNVLPSFYSMGYANVVLTLFLAQVLLVPLCFVTYLNLFFVLQQISWHTVSFALFLLSVLLFYLGLLSLFGDWILN